MSFFRHSMGGCANREVNIVLGNPAPVITSVNPSSITAGETDVEIKGLGFITHKGKVDVVSFIRTDGKVKYFYKRRCSKI